jgi:microcystin-dependent protein
MGTTYGSGDGSTTFNLPDKTGRVSAMQEVSESRLTPSYFGGNSTVLGAVGGGESHTLSLGEIPTGITGAASSPWNVIGSSNSSLAFMTSNSQSTQFSGNAGSGEVWSAMAQGVTVLTQNVQTSGSVISNNTGGGAHRTVQPTIVCNYILRII